MGRATINNNGMAWTIISRNERCAIHAGRYFFAARCGPGTQYTIHEVDRDIGLARTAEILRVFNNRYDVWELSTGVREICGAEPTEPAPCVQCFHMIQPQHEQCPVCAIQQPPRHPSTEWAEYFAALQAQRAA